MTTKTENILNKNYICKNCGKEIKEQWEVEQYLESELCDSCISKIERNYSL